MPKSKTRKNHKQKVVSRNIAISNQKRKNENDIRNYIQTIIKKEQEQGLFDNIKPIDEASI